MIQSLFDNEDEKNQGENAENKTVESPKTDNLSEPQIAESQQNATIESNQRQTAANESGADLQTENSENLENSSAGFEEQGSIPISEPESENIVKDIEYGDNFLELEKESAKIEEEVRLESEEKVEESELKNSFGERPVFTEEQKQPEKDDSTPNNLGIFTAALNKSQQEKQNPEPKQNLTPLEELLIVPDETRTENFENPVETVSENQGFILPNRIETPTENSFLNSTTETNSFLNSTAETSNFDYKPESKAAIIRKSGLAWSAGIAFFGSVVFLLILGWFADLLLGTSPWGAVVGVVLGSIIGFIQFFRLTSQILKDNNE